MLVNIGYRGNKMIHSDVALVTKRPHVVKSQHWSPMFKHLFSYFNFYDS